MPFQNITQKEIQKLLTLLDQAIYNHSQWINNIVRALVCQLMPDQNDVSSESYKKCPFGQWYYGNFNEKIKDHPDFVSLEIAHRRMHLQALNLLKSMEAGQRISQLDYDNLSNLVNQVRIDLLSLKKELENSLYNRDILTATNSRLVMLPILREQQDLLRRKDDVCCIAMMDLDHFKEVNDRYGHVAGDHVLVTVSNYLIQHLRALDKVFRYGGEEFLICLPNTTLQEGDKILNQLREEIAALSIDLGNNQKVSRTVSFGLTLLDPNIAVEESIARCDKALYSAKTEGRNLVICWKKEMA